MRSLFTVILFLFATICFAQEPVFEWGKRIGGTGADVIVTVAADSFGNSYAGGHYDSNVGLFGNISVTPPTPDGTNAFVVKFNGAGQTEWVRSFNGTYGQSVWAMQCDAVGNLYVAGYFSSPTLTLGTTVLTNTGINYSSDLFLAKYDSAGGLLWARSFKGSNSCRADKMVLTNDGNIALAGWYQQDFEIGNTLLANAGNYDAFYALFDTDGNPIWVKNISGTGDEFVQSIAPDGAGGFYLSGYFSGPQLSLGDNAMTTFGNSDIFLTRIGANGNVIWSKQYGGTGSDGHASIAIDPATQEIVFFGRTLSADCALGNVVLQNSSRIFMARISQDGTTLTAKKLGLSIESFADIVPLAIAIDENRNSYISGVIIGSYDLDGVVLTHTPPFLGHFLLKYSPDDEVQWGSVSGVINTYSANCLVSNGTDTVFFGGYFSSSNIGFDNVVVNNANNSWEGFFIKFTNPTLGVEAFGVNTKALYPNPVSNTLFLDRLELDANKEFSIHDMMGRKIIQANIPKNQSINIESLSAGLYLLSSGKESFRFVKE